MRAYDDCGARGALTAAVCPIGATQVPHRATRAARWHDTVRFVRTPAAAVIGGVVVVVVLLAVVVVTRPGRTGDKHPVAPAVAPTSTPAACTSPSSAAPTNVNLPDGIPIPDDLTNVSTSTAASSRRIEATVARDIAAVVADLRGRAVQRPVLTVRGPTEANGVTTLTIDGPSTSAAFELRTPCAGRTDLVIVAKPISGPPPPKP